ncbi:alpha/beta hydrolase family protein [Paludibaculum fermentans]|uniref:Alpha/beta fold hydrolase n=1 Tax=Paludibaculum fermentans TaxID=1473598 RepID=A0A7S7SP47_PALFE|nr:alpha/beta fold hydrolase [Paludibaculum fermentans]QOY90790.1 alpha/beta fold hydrolase [Paludibaculum fermentans]
MGYLFGNDLYDGFGTWPIAYIPYGGADFGELQSVAEATGAGGEDAYYAAWTSVAARLEADASEAEHKGRLHSARELYLKASAFYATSYHPIYGEPVDPRLLTAFRKQVETLDKGLGLLAHPVASMRIPFEQTALPAYLIPAEGLEREARPLIIFTNGYDGTMTDMYFASAVAASRRGYHCLLFDGPGQGEMLYEHGIRLRPDWENVISAVLDFALALPNVRTEEIVLSGWSLGGHLAPRAASGEHRIAALIADPGIWSICGMFRDFAVRTLGVTREAASNLGSLEQSLIDRMDAIINNEPALHWKVVQRGYWVHGVNNLRDYLISAERFTMDGRAELIRCPALLTMPEHDPLASGTPAFFGALRCPKTLLRFSASEGAGDHCEMMNRTLLNRKVLDWLDELFLRA